MGFRQALHELGVRDHTLSPAEKAQLDREGYLPLHDIITITQAQRMREAMQRAFEIEKTGTPDGPSECGQLQNKFDAFDVCVTHPRVLAAIAHVLREEFVSLGVHSRPNPPGKGNQGLHVDYGGPTPKKDSLDYFVCNSMWPLVEFTVKNGATRVVPGTHRWGVAAHEADIDPLAPHPDEVFLTAKVGTMVIFNSHVWHGATLNRSDHDRANVTSYWARRRSHDGTIRRNALSTEAFNRLPEAARCLFDPPEA